MSLSRTSTATFIAILTLVLPFVATADEPSLGYRLRIDAADSGWAPADKDGALIEWLRCRGSKDWPKCEPTLALRRSIETSKLLSQLGSVAPGKEGTLLAVAREVAERHSDRPTRCGRGFAQRLAHLAKQRRCLVQVAEKPVLDRVPGEGFLQTAELVRKRFPDAVYTIDELKKWSDERPVGAELATRRIELRCLDEFDSGWALRGYRVEVLGRTYFYADELRGGENQCVPDPGEK